MAPEDRFQKRVDELKDKFEELSALERGMDIKQGVSYSTISQDDVIGEGCEEIRPIQDSLEGVQVAINVLERRAQLLEIHGLL